MKKTISLFLAGAILVLPLAACSKQRSGSLVEADIKISESEVTEIEETVPEDTKETDSAITETSVDGGSDIDNAEDDKVIKLWSYTTELGELADIFCELHPEFDYEFDFYIYASDNDSYQDALNNSLITESESVPDIFAAEAEFILDYSQGYYSKYVCSYEDLGIDVNQGIIDAQIAPYSVEIGTRQSDGKVIGLAYQSTVGVMYYRASIAEDVWGTSDPEDIKDIIGGGTGSFDKFMVAAKDLKDKGYVALSGIYDLYTPYMNCTSSSWVVDGEIVLDEERDEFIELCTELLENEYSYNHEAWREDWYFDMSDFENPGCFAFFGPSWFGDYTIGWNCEYTYGDWRVTEAPRDFYWGGTWIFGTTYASNSSPEKKAAIAEFLEWVTLDASKEGLQYLLANDFVMSDDVKVPVTSSVVMEMSDGTSELLGDQDMFEVFAIANRNVHNTNMSPNEFTISMLWCDYVYMYANGKIERDEIFERFEENAKAALGML